MADLAKVGCHNDVINIQQFLLKSGYEKEDIVTLIDGLSPKDSKYHLYKDTQPTKENIMREMKALVQDAEPDDLLFLHYSALPTDTYQGTAIKSPIQTAMKWMGKLKDPSVVREAGIKAFKDLRQASNTKEKLAAFSGIRANLKRGRKAVEKTRTEKGSPANVIMFSGSKDWQKAENGNSGMMSSMFMEALNRKPEQTYLELLRNIRDSLAKNDYKQRPQISCSHQMDLNSIFRM
ncbi:hypothetical protein FGG08_001016 [Glutinoglossum americanum]|uniref:Peptidase C14 caspase domain-containing protein n=1 Tax=Glutinoglossum americanum TaxID=1670608 RepID=A0A9P8I2W8_9PEZI|nr:hypothetical protein FGG08_001016 [Glutinoglossum americanum]